jgi:tetratricopeptide (TPR) repeat protein
MKEKMLFLLEELKENYTEQIFKDTLECFRNEISLNDLHKDIERTKNAINGQVDSFYNELAKDFVEDLNEYTEIYFMLWEYLIHLFNEKTKSYFYKTSLEIAGNSDATDYIKGLLELEKDNAEIALFHFNNIDDYVANYFVGLCYLETENYENSINQNLLFLKEFENMINNQKDIDLLNESDLIIVKWNIYNDLGYAYNRISEFENALSFYDKALQIFSLEEAFIIRHSIEVDKNLDDFSIFVNNYLLSLEQTNKLTKCIEILEFVISKYPNDLFYIDRKTRLIEKTEKHSFANEIINTLFRIKKPFNLNSFQETKLISKEKILEDMIVEQIKYGFNVFGKRLEIYNDNEIFGRQYYIKSVNGILDLLLIDKANDVLYVVELKRNEAGIEVVEQIENYIKGLKSQLNREVKGIISLHKPDRNLIELVKTKANIEIYTYEFQFKNIE